MNKNILFGFHFFLFVLSPFFANGETTGKENHNDVLREATSIPPGKKEVRLAISPMSIRSLSLSYSSEYSEDNETTWQLRFEHQLFWDIDNNKYFYKTINFCDTNVGEKGKRDIHKTQEVFCENGKWWIVQGEQRYQKGDTHYPIQNQQVSIGKEGFPVFFFPFSYLYGLNDRIFSLTGKEIKREGEMIVITEKTPTKKVGNFSKITFWFNAKTGAFVKKRKETINSEGKQVGTYLEFIIPQNDNFLINEIHFPKAIIVRFYDRNKKLESSTRFKFFEDVKINTKIPSKIFIPQIKNGTLVHDALENKTYRFSNNKSNEKEAAANLDALFESAESAKRKHD